jgi:hypothetical protein
VLQVGGVDMYVDLGAEKLLAAEKDQQRIAYVDQLRNEWDERP